MSSNLFNSHSVGSLLKYLRSVQEQTGSTSPVTVSRCFRRHSAHAGDVCGAGLGPKPPQIVACWLTEKQQTQYANSSAPRV
eukprot:CAMPEP_0115468372 /NCGR_PEP_ID=MMETSP0271-20121206/50922_1 /TAXON_ID=71861 /ORGANISM="Scrippsiella trochoidea, Strain CCMP3099" /LENGTH=80 /DNA_ID=CAMNT_0002895421 /DNA_START=371 /DNA_END=613 /DNA_ORIENTATION=+